MRSSQLHPPRGLAPLTPSARSACPRTERVVFHEYTRGSAQRRAVSLEFLPRRTSLSDEPFGPPPRSAPATSALFFPVHAKHADMGGPRFPRRSVTDMSCIVVPKRIDVSVNDLYPQPKLMRRDMRLLRHKSTWQLVYQHDHDV